MTRRGMIRLMLATGAAAALAGCGLSSTHFGYRMTVEGTYPGTAVYEMLAEKVNGPRLADEKPGGSIIKGEALVIETPSGPVFLLLKAADSSGDVKEGVMRALAPDVPRSAEPYSWAVATRLAGAKDGEAKGELARKDWPMMVRFRDVHDPMTVERVEPGAIGVRRISLDTTGEAMTTGIEKMLKWLSVLHGNYLHGGDTVRGAPLGLAAGDFSTEIK